MVSVAGACQERGLSQVIRGSGASLTHKRRRGIGSSGLGAREEEGREGGSEACLEAGFCTVGGTSAVDCDRA